MYDTILVPTDDSEVASTAAAAGIALARRFDATLHALHVQEVWEYSPDTEDEQDGPQVHQEAHSVEEIATQASNADVDVTTALVPGDTAIHRAIANYAEEHDADCIVMGTHGRTGINRFVMGSVAERVIRDSPIPVLSVHEDTSVPTEFASVLVPTDGSSPSDLAADHALEFADATGADVHAIFVVEKAVARDGTGLDVAIEALGSAGRTVLEDLRERAVAEGHPPIDTQIVEGRPYRGIVDYAREHDVDCIVLGTHGRSGIDRFILGSVAGRVVRLSDVPVLTVGDPDRAT